MGRRPRLDMKQPIYVDGREVTVVFIFPNGNFAAVYPGESRLRQFGAYGNPLDAGWKVATNEGPVTTEVVTLYPNGNVYVKGEPVRSSSFGVDQLIQVRITRRGGRIINKELLP